MVPFHRPLIHGKYLVHREVIPLHILRHFVHQFRPFDNHSCLPDTWFKYSDMYITTKERR